MSDLRSPLCPKVGNGKGRARDAREALRPPGLPGHRGALEPPARLFPEAQTHQQPPGPLWTREFLFLIFVVYISSEPEKYAWCVLAVDTIHVFGL